MTLLELKQCCFSCSFACITLKSESNLNLSFAVSMGKTGGVINSYLLCWKAFFSPLKFIFIFLYLIYWYQMFSKIFWEMRTKKLTIRQNDLPCFTKFHGFSLTTAFHLSLTGMYDSFPSFNKNIRPMYVKWCLKSWHFQSELYQSFEKIS